MQSSIGMTKIFSVANVAALGAFDDGLDGFIHKLLVDRDFDTDFFEQADGADLAAVVLGEAHLRAAAAYAADGHFVNLGMKERLFHVVEFFRLDYSNNHFHNKSSFCERVRF